ncbi:MAG: aa3-type cytochrome c oxidase subunit IV [Hyphomicrobiaceae bacterium]
MSLDTSGGHKAMDYAEHTRTYAGFLRLTKISVVALILLLVGMYVFLV